MKSVLCYGDSLTWGDRPDGTGRHPLPDRWPGALAARLGQGVEVVAEGLNGRTTAWDMLDGGPADRNGARHLPVALHSHAPLDLVILMLGTNDAINLRSDVYRTALGMKRLVEIALWHPYPRGLPRPQVLVVAPPRIRVCDWAGEAEVAVVDGLGAAYAQVASEFGVAFFDAAPVALGSTVDGVHLDADVSRGLGEALAPKVAELLGV